MGVAALVYSLLDLAMMRGMVRALSTMVVVAFAAAGCSGAPLGGGTGGGTGAGGKVAPCTTYTGCGTGSGGINGSGGSGAGGDSGALCDQLNAAYASALTAALACTPGAPNQCQAVVGIYPTACPGADCSGLEYVNDGMTVEAAREDWLAACEPGIHSGCSAIACGSPPPPTTCLPTSPGATTGTCVPYGSDAGAAIVPDGGESCDQLVADYEAAVTAALACTPGAASQCQSYVATTAANGPDPSDCQPMTVVNDPTGVNAALQRWSAQCFTGGPILLIKCDPPTQKASCVPNVDAGALTSTGTCAVTAPD
jgi:hypothetical protein